MEESAAIPALSENERPPLDFEPLFEGAPVAMCLIGNDARLVAANAAGRALLGCARVAAGGEALEPFFVSKGELALLIGELERSDRLSDYPIRLLHADGEERETAVTASPWLDGAGTKLGYQLVLRDDTERRRAEAQLHRSALHDPLTGLPNRSLFKSRLEQSLRHARRRDRYRFAVLFLDLDRFKVVNDSLGHLVGDRLLAEVASRLTTCVREVDTVARLGGDEFAILLDDIGGESDATVVAERIQEQLARPAHVGRHDLFSSVSIGIAFSSSGYETAEDALRDADIAMYRAKALGRGRYELFDEGMHAQVLRVLELETDLRGAVEREEFAVHYQPIVTMATKRLTGFEALLRWRHPERGLLGPADFLEVAEETGLIVPIGWWFLDQACRQLREWQKAFPETPLTVSVNLSGKQIRQPELVDRIRAALEDSGLSGSSLKLEITESVLMDDAEAAIRTLERLKAMGVRLSIDDFGTGYSSLAYLHRFPFDTVKIDRSFIGGLDSAEPNQELVWSIVSLAHSLGMDVVGEGVETMDQFDELKALSCEYAQGFLFSRAVDEDGAAALLGSATPNRP